jgi:hypothetical protein
VNRFKARDDHGRLAALSKVFSPLVMDHLVLQGRSAYLNELLSNVGVPDQVDTSETVSSFLSTLYRQLVAHYRCEYVYKNEIASKILLGRHSLNTAQLLTEVRVGKSKADVVVINGTSTAYEIKSEYDSLARLPQQLESYSGVFERVNVVTSASRVGHVLAMAPRHVGVIVLSERCTLSTVRASGSNMVGIQGACLFDLLRKPEYSFVIKTHFGALPTAPTGRFHAACEDMFLQIPIAEAHRLTMNALSKRFSGAALQVHAPDIPLAMRAYACSISSDEGRLEGLAALLARPMSLIGT